MPAGKGLSKLAWLVAGRSVAISVVFRLPPVVPNVKR